MKGTRVVTSEGIVIENLEQHMAAKKGHAAYDSRERRKHGKQPLDYNSWINHNPALPATQGQNNKITW